MLHLETLGNVLTCGLALVAVFVVPIKLARVWWPVVWARVAPFLMSRSRGDTSRATDTEAVHVPVLSTDTSASTTPPALDITDDSDLPRVSTRHSDQTIVIYLAAQRGEDGAKYRFSANQIYELVKGPRADVLRQIKEVREGPAEPVYRQYTADEQAVLAQR